MPCTSIPEVTNVSNLFKKLDVINPKAVVDYALWGGICSNDLPLKKSMIKALWKEGVVGFKMYTISSMESFKAMSYPQIEMVLTEFPDILFAFHAEDQQIIEQCFLQYQDKDLTNPKYFVKMRPVEAEWKAVKMIMQCCNKNKIHFVHISSEKAAREIIKYKKSHDISFETCPHYLEFTSDDFVTLKGRLKTAPPVKYEANRKFLQNCLEKGLVDYISTDHAGCDFETEKNIADFSKVYNGIPGTQLMIPYLFSEFYQTGKISLQTIIKVTSQNQAKRLGLFPRKGSLEIGTDADFTIINLNNGFRVDEKELQSKGKYSPFVGKVFNCKIDKTIVRGELVFDQKYGILQKPGFGEWIRREKKISR